MTHGEPPPFHEPKLAIDCVYTRSGDRGDTSLIGGARVPKDHPRLESFGDVDELNAAIGAARVSLSEIGSKTELLDPILLRIQQALFNLGSLLATPASQLGESQPRILDADVLWLEESLDRLNRELPPLRSFVLPGGSRCAADLHLARTVCRRAERSSVHLCSAELVDPTAIRYLNRLGDALFVFARWVLQVEGRPEALWNPNA